MRDHLPLVDVHAHLPPPRLAAAVRAALERMYGWRIPWPLEPEAVLADLRAAGTDRLVHLPYAHRPGIAASLNEHSLGLAAAHPEVIPFATVHPDDEAPVALLAGAVAAGARGLKVHCAVQRSAPDDPRLDPVLAWCEAEALPVLMHASHTPDPSTPYTAPSCFAALMARHPRLRICVAHLGAPDSDAFLDVVLRHEHAVLDTAGLPDLLAADGALTERLCAHPERILYASDYPNTPAGPDDSVAAVRRLGLGDAALRAVLAGNALRFLGEEADAPLPLP